MVGAMAPHRLIVIGCGNRLASDDAAGLEVVAQLRRVPDHCWEVSEFDQSSPGFIAELSSGATVLFVDAIHSKSRPGTIHGFCLAAHDALPATMNSVSAVQIRQEIDLARKKSESLPQLFVLAIEAERWDHGIGITSSVQAAVAEIVRELAKVKEKEQPKLPFFDKP